MVLLEVNDVTTILTFFSHKTKVNESPSPDTPLSTNYSLKDKIRRFLNPYCGYYLLPVLEQNCAKLWAVLRFSKPIIVGCLFENVRMTKFLCISVCVCTMSRVSSFFCDVGENVCRKKLTMRFYGFLFQVKMKLHCEARRSLLNTRSLPQNSSCSWPWECVRAVLQPSFSETHFHRVLFDTFRLSRSQKQDWVQRSKSSCQPWWLAETDHGCQDDVFVGITGCPTLPEPIHRRSSFRCEHLPPVKLPLCAHFLLTGRDQVRKYRTLCIK